MNNLPNILASLAPIPFTLDIVDSLSPYEEEELGYENIRLIYCPASFLLRSNIDPLFSILNLRALYLCILI